jgi:predicted aldo/keto reductase-like oxidoreductase
MRRFFEFRGALPPVVRLGLATRGNTRLDPSDVRAAIERGVNYLNWCGHPDGMSRAVAELGPLRKRVVVAWQLEATAAVAAERALDEALRQLGTDFVDIVTFYYVESEAQWRRILAPGGAYEAMVRAQERGKVRLLGLTSHQRAMAARIAGGEGRPLDLLMLRYNAAHRLNLESR